MTILIPLPGIPANFSMLAALSAGIVPANVQTTVVKGAPNPTALSLLSAGALTTIVPASTVPITTVYGGN
jgi:hypothetical protein